MKYGICVVENLLVLYAPDGLPEEADCLMRKIAPISLSVDKQRLTGAPGANKVQGET